MPSPDAGVPNLDAGAVAPKPDARTSDLALMPDTSTSSTVTFSAGVAKGAMTGYGWVQMGALDIVSSPTCGPTNAPITSADSCASTSTNCGGANARCLSAVIPAPSASPTSTELIDNWGVQLGCRCAIWRAKR